MCQQQQPTGPHSPCVCDSHAGGFHSAAALVSGCVLLLHAGESSARSHPSVTLFFKDWSPWQVEGALPFIRAYLGPDMQFGHCTCRRRSWKSFRGEQHELFQVQKIRFVNSKDLGNISLGNRRLLGKDKCLKQGKNALRKEGNNPSVPGKGSEIMYFNCSKYFS